MDDIGKSIGESRYRWPVCWTAVVLLMFALAVRTSADDNEEGARLNLPLAKINGRPVTIYYFEASVAKLPRVEREALASPKEHETFLGELIAERLKANEAIRRGYDKHQAVQALLKRKLASMMEIYIGSPVNDMVPSEKALRQYYEQHLEAYHKPEMLRARHMLFKDPKKAREVLERLLLRKPREEGFHGGGKKGLNMGFFPRPEALRKGDSKTVPALAEAAFKLEKDGDIYPALIPTEYGHHILMRTAYRPAEHKSFEEVRERGLESAYKGALKQQKLAAAVEALKKRYPVVIDEAALQEVPIAP